MIREFPFTLPKGWLDPQGNLQRDGVMRLATGTDEFMVQRHPAVMQNPYYGTLVMFAQVVTKLGDTTAFTPEMFGDLFIIDSVYLQRFYNTINRDTGEGDVSGE